MRLPQPIRTFYYRLARTTPRSVLHAMAKGWFNGVSDFSTPEGHIWGKKGHQIVGENLAHVILGDPSSLAEQARASGFEVRLADSPY